MAAFWNVIRAEVQASVDEFREKGVVGTFRDAALDAVDIAKSGGELLMDGVQSLTGEGDEPPILRAEGLPAKGAFATLELAPGRVTQALVVDVDAVSDPPRAQVTVVGEENNPPIVVDVRPPDWARESGAGGIVVSAMDSLKQEWNSTVQDFREKGAVGAVRDATLDAVDLLSSTAAEVASGAQSAAAPLKQELDHTINDFREKGAVGALKDATLDAVDLVGSSASAAAGVVGSSASAAAEGARSLAAPLLDLSEPAGGAAAIGDTAEPAELGLLDGLKMEVRNTVQDFREKGAIGTLKDATLDAVDLVGSSASAAAEVVGSSASAAAEVVGPSARAAAEAVGSSASAAAESARSLAAPLLDQSEPAGGEAEPAELGLLDELKMEVRNTVQDFREKGAIGTLKDATLDAADMVAGAATAAAGGARTLGGSLMDLATVQEDEPAAPPSALPTAAASAGGYPAQAPAAQPPAPAPAVLAPAAAAAAPAAQPAAARAPAAAPGTPPAKNPGFKVKSPEVHRMDGADTPTQQPARTKSLVQMRREAFEKKQQASEAEELID